MRHQWLKTARCPKHARGVGIGSKNAVEIDLNAPNVLRPALDASQELAVLSLMTETQTQEPLSRSNPASLSI